LLRFPGPTPAIGPTVRSDIQSRPRHILLADAVRIFAGAERFLLDAGLGLSERGYRVTIQAYPDCPLAEKAEEAGLDVHRVTTRADGAPWTVAPLLSWLVDNEVDVVLSNYDKDLRTVGWAARMARRPIAVLHSRECDVPLKNLPHYRFFYNRVAHHILTNSKATRNSTLENAPWLQPERISVLPKGVDLSSFAVADGRGLRSDWGIGAEETLLGFAGQLVPRKRCAELLESLAHDSLRKRSWRLAIAGQGPEEAALRESVRVLGLSERVVFCGYIEEIAPFMRAIDVFLLPSFVEGFGYVLAEAAAAGTPAFAYRSSSMPELISHGETGLLGDPELPGSLLHALLPLIDDSELRHRMGTKAMEHARKHFAMSLMLDRLEDRIVRCYQAMLSSNEAPLPATELEDGEETARETRSEEADA
jgi:glycosyltransferase involved in cell wall biosynthesis